MLYENFDLSGNFDLLDVVDYVEKRTPQEPVNFEENEVEEE
ncbi:MAG: hypothetical protein PHG08_00900 [Bacilli bacterium]|nr:hypothetical protein [Bacilli bacterium]